MIVLNEPNECYTFLGMTGQNNIDVTLASREVARCQFEWDVRSDWEISDHNVILIRMMYRDSDEGEKCDGKKCTCKNVH